MFSIRYATNNDQNDWFLIDRHMSKDEYPIKVRDKRAYMIFDDEKYIGVMRYNLFWDEIPFLNLIYLLEESRGKGCGSKAMAHWECEMRALGHKMLITSTQVDEQAQHFYRKLGYRDAGGLLVDGQAMEMFMVKSLGLSNIPETNSL